MTTAPSPSTPPSPTAAEGGRPGVLAELEYAQLLQCVHCGLCLPSCPTYAELGQEPDSPRGRIYLIKALADGRIGLSDSAAGHLSLCLGCRACESACPSGVQYGHLIEAGRADLETRRPGSLFRRLVRRVAFEWLLPRPALLRAVASGLRFYQRSGLQHLVRASGLLRLLPASLGASEALLPPLPPAGRGGALPEVTAARGTRRGSVGLLHGCVQDAVFRPHNEATIRCLVRQGG